MRRRALLAPLALALLMLGNAEASADPAYISGTYTGRVQAEIDDRGLSITKRRYGQATAEFKRLSPSRARLVVFGTIRDKGDASFTIEGSYGRSGFRGEGKGLNLTIDPAGKISGGGAVNDQEYRFSGTVSHARFDLNVQNRPTAKAKPSTIRGIAFSYELSQEVASKGKASSGRCREIRYEMRPVANIGDGTMSMLSVPVCLK